MAGCWSAPASPDEEFEAEWEMRRRDLAGLISAQEMDRLRVADGQAMETGRRMLFVPTFYAWGTKGA